MYQQAPNPKSQNHRCLDEWMRYYSFRYSIVCYRILVFLMCKLQCFSPLPPDPLRQMWHFFRGDACNYLQHMRPSHNMSQLNTLWTPISILMCPYLIIYTRRTPNISGPYQIQARDTSGYWQAQGHEGGDNDPRFIGFSSRRHHWRQTRSFWRRHVQVRANDITPGQVGRDQER